MTCFVLKCVKIPKRSFVPLSVYLYNVHCCSVPILSFLDKINGKNVQSVEEVRNWFKTFCNYARTPFLADIFLCFGPLIELYIRKKLVAKNELFHCSRVELRMQQVEEELVIHDCCFCKNIAVSYLHNYFENVFEKYYWIAKSIVKKECDDVNNPYAFNLLLSILKLISTSIIGKELEDLLWKKIKRVQSFVIKRGIVDGKIQLHFDACCKHTENELLV